MKVDQDMGRLWVNYKCPVCEMPGDNGRGFFVMDICILIALIQEAYHTKPRKKVTVHIQSHHLSVLILFCTLREVLLERLISRLMEMDGLSETERERLNCDNRNYSDRRERLFPSLIRAKSWNDAITQLQHKTGENYGDINDFLKKASDMRNNMLHEGITWPFEPDFITDCLKKIPLLLGLYVDFHNSFIHPEYFKRLGAQKTKEDMEGQVTSTKERGIIQD